MLSLVNAVDERSVEVEEHPGRLGRGLDHRLGHVYGPSARRGIRPRNAVGDADLPAVLPRQGELLTG
jgi:hypothetical protein